MLHRTVCSPNSGIRQLFFCTRALNLQANVKTNYQHHVLPFIKKNRRAHRNTIKSGNLWRCSYQHEANVASLFIASSGMKNASCSDINKGCKRTCFPATPQGFNVANCAWRLRMNNIVSIQRSASHISGEREKVCLPFRFMSSICNASLCSYAG